MSVKIPLRDEPSAGTEPAPAFASEAEVKLAEKLRRQLEERYLGSSAASLSRRSSDKGH
jgi:hypothetical protein